jgi:hypothetical protein
MSDAVTAGNDPDFDEGRELCADGNCLGVVADGKCNVCGLVAAAGSSPRDPASGQTGGKITDGGAGDMVAEGGHTDGTFDDDDRQLCADGACTGLVGSDGKCKECGRSAAS